MNKLQKLSSVLENNIPQIQKIIIEEYLDSPFLTANLIARTKDLLEQCGIEYSIINKDCKDCYDRFLDKNSLIFEIHQLGRMDFEYGKDFSTAKQTISFYLWGNNKLYPVLKHSPIQ